MVNYVIFFVGSWLALLGGRVVDLGTGTFTIEIERASLLVQANSGGRKSYFYHWSDGAVIPGNQNWKRLKIIIKVPK